MTEEKILISSYNLDELKNLESEYIEKGYSPGILSIYFDKIQLKKKFSKFMIK